MTTYSAGVSMAMDKQGRVIVARLMGRPDQCLQLDEGFEHWCVLPYPHEGEHDFQGGGSQPQQ
jgi:hypothetical protein